MRYFTIAILLLVFSLKAISQNKMLVITGIVKNQKGRVVENAHVFSSTSGQGVISNRDGLFNIHVAPESEMLIISHVSYKEQKVNFANEKALGDSIYLEIILEVNPNYLSSIDIVESKRWQVVKPDRVWVYDYELMHEDEILLLLKDTAKYELRYLNKNSKVVDNLSFRRNKPNKLVHDGLGNIFLDQRDSIFQIFVDEKGIGFYNGILKSDFDLLIKPVVGGNSEFVFFKALSQNNQLLTYFYINRETKSEGELISVFDKKSFLNNKGIEEELLTLAGINQMGEIWIDELNQWKDFYELKSFNEEIAKLPVYSPLIQFGECVCVFDLINGFMLTFNANGELIKEHEISFHLNKKVYSIEVDKATGDFYSLWKKNGVVHIDKINMQNGTVAKTYLLKDYIFPEKVQFRNGQIYFLYSDYNFNKKLFKMPISRL